MTAIQLRHRRYLKQTRSRPRSGRRRRQFSLHSCSPSWPFSGSKGSESMTRSVSCSTRSRRQLEICQAIERDRILYNAVGFALGCVIAAPPPEATAPAIRHDSTRNASR